MTRYTSPKRTSMTAEDRIAIWRKAVAGATFAELGALADERRIHRGTMRAFLKKVKEGQALSDSDLRLLYAQERARNDYVVAQQAVRPPAIGATEAGVHHEMV